MGTYYDTDKISRKQWDNDLWTEWKTTPQNHGPSHKLVITKNKEKHLSRMCTKMMESSIAS